MSDERVDAIERALSLKPGDEFEGATLLRKGVENGHFVWWLSSGGCVSLNNLIAKIRPDKTSARRDLAAARELLAEESRLMLCREYQGGNADATISYCIDLTDPDGKPTCWHCRVRAFLAATPPLSEPILVTHHTRSCPHSFDGSCDCPKGPLP